MNFWLHPSLILIFGALLLPLVPARLKKGYLLLIPILLFARILSMPSAPMGAAILTGKVQFLDWELVFGRIDRLSSVFGYIMSLMCILGTLYGLHVKDDKQHIVAWFYVGGSIGAIYAGDYLTLFLFWELMAFSSVFLVWFRGRRESLRVELPPRGPGRDPRGVLLGQRSARADRQARPFPGAPDGARQEPDRAARCRARPAPRRPGDGARP